ncbi:Retrotransposon nucleocapsid protein [Madurella fahalii]|uniref:Retrotransposon nucleocapsid protein n=1 Tax=Madurella fahalii TaxID=1157608 RepID=A0ABQ0G2Q8_9PEZI
MPREELIVLRKTLTELLDKDFIRASSSPAAAPILFAKKPGGGLRFCVDYRGLNAITRKDRYPLPLIHETLRSLAKAKWLTKLDVIAAFHKIRIKEDDEWKTAFRIRYGLFEYLVTPFGVTGALATFQRYINRALQRYLEEFASAYLDDTSSSAPLVALTKKGGPFLWTDECEKAFKDPKALLISAPVEAQWDPDRKTVLETDFSSYATGGALSQYDDNGLLHPVAFFSKKNNPAECNYPIHDKELLAVIRRLEHRDAELRSAPSFEILTDHKNLEYFQKKRQLKANDRYRPGKEAVVQDALSRREQDMPAGGFDEKLAGRYFQLLKVRKGHVTICRGQVGTLLALTATGNSTSSPRQTDTKAGDQDRSNDEPADKSDPPLNLFDGSPLKELWDEGLEANNQYWLLREMVRRGERQISPQWGLPISISECTIDEGGRLC